MAKGLLLNLKFLYRESILFFKHFKPFALLVLLLLSFACSSNAGLIVKGMPIFDYDPDMGAGFGVYGEGLLLSKDTTIKDSLRLQGRLYATTALILAPFVEVEYIKSCNWKLTLRASYERTTFNNYFGFGNSDKELDYSSEKASNFTYSYAKSVPSVIILYGLYLNLGLPDLFKHSEIEIGIRTENYSIFKSPKIPPDGIDPILFSQKPLGINGGVIHEEIVGYTIDKRDDLYNPSYGTFFNLYGSISNKNLGSTYSYAQGTTIFALYRTPFENLRGLTFAGRLLANYIYGDAPFFKYEKTLAVDPQDLLGGRGSIRGIPQYKYKDAFCYVITPEIRTKLFKVHALGEDWSLGSVLFSDVGNTFPSPLKIEPKAYFTYGCGLRFGWGDDFVLSVDLGFYKTDLNGIYIYFGQQF